MLPSHPSGQVFVDEAIMHSIYNSGSRKLSDSSIIGFFWVFWC